MIDKRKVAAYLAKGVAESAIADAVGCDISYVSQLKHDNEIQELIKEYESELTAKEAEFDSLLFDAKHQALTQIKKMLPFADMNKSLAAFRILDAAHSVKSDKQAGGVSVNVTLTLPASVVPTYVIDNRSQIVEVEGRTMVSATPKTLDMILEARAAGDPSVPTLTPQEKAVVRLGGISVLPPREPRKSPLARPGVPLPSEL